jgi:PAS domain S-box-containing protein
MVKPGGDDVIQDISNDGPAMPGRGRALLAALAVCAALCVGLFQASAWQENRHLAAERRELEESIQAPARFLSDLVFIRAGLLGVLEGFVRNAELIPGRQQERFENIVGFLDYGFKDVRVLALAPQGRVSMVYPPGGNEAILGRDQINDPRPGVRDDVARAMATGRVVLGEPYELNMAPGGLGLVMRKAVTVDGRFWGLATLALDVSALVAATPLPNRTDIVFALVSGGQVFYGNPAVAKDRPVTAPVPLPEGQGWELWAVPREGWAARGAGSARAFLATGGAFVALLTLLVYVFIRRTALLRRVVELTALQARTSESLYRRVFDSVLDGILIFDARGRVLSANPAACAMHGQRSMEGFRPRDFIHPESLRLFQEFLETASQGREFHSQGRGLRADGTVFPVEVRGTSFALSGGQRYLAVVRDQSEQERLRAERERFFALTLDLVGVSDLDKGLFRQVNPAWTQVLGFEPEEIIGRPWQEFVHPEDQAATQAAIREAAQGAGLRGFVNRWRTKGGDWRWLSWNAQPDRALGVAYAVARDVTGERLAAQKLRAANEELAAMNEELTSSNEEMAALNEEMTSTNEELLAEISRRSGAEDLLRASLAEKEVLLKELHHRVKNNLQVVSSLLGLQAGSVTDPAALALFEEGKNRIASMALVHEELYRSDDLSRVDLRQYLEKLARRLAGSLARDAAVDLALDLESILLSVDTAIPCGLLVNELVTNALKHGLAGREVLRLAVRARREQDRVLLRVADDGPGFPAHLDFRNTESLGMQLVVHLAEQLQGVLELEPGPGCAFSLSFPLRDA